MNFILKVGRKSLLLQILLITDWNMAHAFVCCLHRPYKNRWEMNIVFNYYWMIDFVWGLIMSYVFASFWQCGISRILYAQTDSKATVFVDLIVHSMSSEFSCVYIYWRKRLIYKWYVRVCRVFACVYVCVCVQTFVCLTACLRASMFVFLFVINRLRRNATKQ